MGQSFPTGEGAAALTGLTDTLSGKEKAEGAFAGNVYGTYVHGVFDAEETAKALVLALAKEKGVDLSLETMDFAAYKETQYEKLAAGLRAHLNMKEIYRILEEGA